MKTIIICSSIEFGRVNYCPVDDKLLIDESIENLKRSAGISADAFIDLSKVLKTTNLDLSEFNKTIEKLKSLPGPFRKFKEPKRNFTKKFNKNSHRI